MSRHHSVEWCCVVPQPGLADPHEGQSLSIQDVEAAASVHQHLGETGLGDDRVDDQRVAPGIGDAIRVILCVERNHAL